MSMRLAGCALVLAAAVTLAGCGDEPSASPSSPPSPSVSLPPGVEAKAPEAPAEVSGTEQGAVEYARYFAKVVQHAIRVRDSTPIAALARDQATCDSCRAMADYIEGLEDDKLWEDADDLEILRLRARALGTATFRVTGPAVYPRISFVDDSGREQTQQEASSYVFEVDLVWDADRTRWQVEDFSLINKGELTS